MSKPWTDEEKHLLRAAYGKAPDARALVKELRAAGVKRSVPAVYMQLTRQLSGGANKLEGHLPELSALRQLALKKCPSQLTAASRKRRLRSKRKKLSQQTRAAAPAARVQADVILRAREAGAKEVVLPDGTKVVF